jgi:hypothetical protein
MRARHAASLETVLLDRRRSFAAAREHGAAERGEAGEQRATFHGTGFAIGHWGPPSMKGRRIGGDPPLR